MTTTYDAVIIGSGHNGLTAGCYLAKAGLNVAIFEERSEPGGGMYTEAFEDHPQFLRNNHAINFLNVRESPVHKDLALERFGAQLIDPVTKVGLPTSDGRALMLYSDPLLTKREIARFSEEDAETYEELYYDWMQLAHNIQRPEWYNPPRSLEERREIFEGTEKGERYLDIITRSPVDVITEHFENEHVQGLLTIMDQAVGPHPFEQGIDGSLIHAFDGWHNLQIARGGSNQYAQSLVNCFEHYGGDLYLDSLVDSVTVENGTATGITLVDGTPIETDIVVSNVHYPQTYLNLVGREHLEEQFIREIEEKYELMEGPLFGVHLALDEPLEFSSVKFNPDMQRAVKFTLGIESPDDIKRVSESAKTNELPDEPVMSAGSVTVLDPSQAPDEKHTAYLWAPSPWNVEDEGPEYWDEVKDEFMEVCIDKLAEYAPNVREDDIIVDKYAYSPLDIARTHRNMIQGSRSGGNWGPEQLMDNRPSYSGPIGNLYLSGAPTHPGGSITCAPGYNCAGVIVDDFGLDKWWRPPEIDV
ncbi:phytoene desaturase family protein [Saliphagus sp. GCM10025334]